MASQSNPAFLVAIVGETASGKSALALHLAQAFNGEIIAADSRTIYKGMDIGTAKPTAEERALVPHHLLDIVTPDMPFTVAEFKQRAETAVQEIAARGRLPFLVGGTGLYVDAILYDFSFRDAPDPAMRERLSAMTVEQLQSLALERRIALPQNDRNPRHLIRAIETNGQESRRQPLRPNTVVIGLEVDRDVLELRVSRRIDAMIERGVLDEVRRLGKQYGWDAVPLQAPGYKAFRDYLLGALNMNEMHERAIRETMQLAKRQRTWFRRNKSIHWIREKEQAVDLLTTILSK